MTRRNGQVKSYFKRKKETSGLNISPLCLIKFKYFFSIRHKFKITLTFLKDKLSNFLGFGVVFATSRFFLLPQTYSKNEILH